MSDPDEFETKQWCPALTRSHLLRIWAHPTGDLSYPNLLNFLSDAGDSCDILSVSRINPLS